MDEDIIKHEDTQITPDLEVVAEQIKQVYMGAITQSHQILLDGYHQIGQLILALPSKLDAVKDLSLATGISTRILYYSAKFAEKFPDPKDFPEGDNLTWNKVITKYLPERRKDIECQHNWITVCSKCHVRKND